MDTNQFYKLVVSILGPVFFRLWKQSKYNSILCVLNTRENKKRPKILVLLSFLRINYCAGWMWRIWQRAFSTRMQRRTLTSSAANALKYVSIPSRRNIYSGNSRDRPPTFSIKSSLASGHIYMSPCSATVAHFWQKHRTMLYVPHACTVKKDNFLIFKEI
jgi:hypothetical protein